MIFSAGLFFWLTAIGTTMALGLAALTWNNLRKVAEPALEPRGTDDVISVLIPMRNEAENVDQVLAGLIDQRGVPNLEILIIDDGSQDSTAENIARWSQAHDHVRVFTAEELASGWLGKPAACYQVAQHARGSVLIFVDADVHFAPHALAAATDLLGDLDVDWISPYPRQLAVTWSERLTQPLVHWLWWATLPFRWAYSAPFPSTAIANGQFFAIKTKAYRAVHGHLSVRDAVLDDVKLAQSLRRAGFRGGAANGATLASCRMYTSWHEVHRGYQKSLWSSFGAVLPSLVVSLVFALTYLLPPLAVALAVVNQFLQTSFLIGTQVGAAIGADLESANTALGGLGLLGYLAGLWSRYAVAERTGCRSLPDSAAHPLSILMLIMLLASSWIAKWRGTLNWKGRTL